MVDSSLCCGCNVCGDVCPEGAIKFTPNDEGFLCPEINAAKCKGCNLCGKVCPMINAESLRKHSNGETRYFSAENKNMEAVFGSSSGGIFHSLSEHFYRKGGYVGGALLGEDFEVRHYVSDSKGDLPRLRSSKYVQSNAQGFYTKVRGLLDAGKSVLVCGTPCQMAAMRAFLGRDYEKLVTVDFLCGGVASPLVWRKYIDFLSESHGSNAVTARFDSKEYGWSNHTLKTVLEDGRNVYEHEDACGFLQFYRAGLCVRESCLGCKFKAGNVADITLGNFIMPLDRKNLGRSLVVLNTEKGRLLFGDIMGKLEVSELAGFPDGNSRTETPPLQPPGKREEFFRDIGGLPFGEAVKKYAAMKHKTFKDTKIWKFLRRVKQFVKWTRLRPSAVFNTLRYSGIRNLIHGKGIIFCAGSKAEIQRDTEIEIGGLLIIGVNGVLRIRNKGKLSILGDFHFSRGGYIHVDGGHLIIHGNKYEKSSGANINCLVACNNMIEIGYDVQIGFNVRIHDASAHYINRQGYKASRPVIIGDKAWLCSSCMIMPGVRVGEGAIVGAKSFVIQSVPARSMVSGHPAKVIDRNVQWKY